MTGRATAPPGVDVRALVERLAPTNGVQVVSAVHEKSFPKKDQIDLYRVELSDRSHDWATPLAVHRLPDDRRAKALAKLHKAGERLGRVDPRRPAIYGEVPSEGLLLYSFPLDPKLARLPDAVAPSRASAKMRATVTAVEVVRYVPARRCQLRWLTPSGVVYAKLYHDDRGAQVFRTMQLLHGRLAANGPSEVSTPAPIGYVAEWNALLQQEAPGVTLHALCAAGHADAGAFALCGWALAAMHGAGEQAPRTHSAQDELQVVAHWLTLAKRRSPQFGELRHRVDRLQPFADPARSPRLAVVHRDCYDRQFLIDGDRAAIIDLDEIANGEPELDIGNFLAHLELRQIQGVLSPAASERGRIAFLESYQALSRRHLDPRRLAFYLATALARLAALYSLRPGQTASSDALVPRARAVVSMALQPAKPDILS